MSKPSGSPDAKKEQLDCGKLMELYVQCVRSKKRGLSPSEGECEEQKKAYRSCVAAAKSK